MITDTDATETVLSDSSYAHDPQPDSRTQLLMRLIRKHKGISLSAETPRLAATPAPRGKPGGPGLYHMKGAKLPNYIENMRNALMRGGMSEGRATATAINACKRLAATSKHPEVKAAAAAAIAELKATAARAKAMSRDDVLAEPIDLFNTMHVGAGSATGGQFAPKAGGGGGAATKPPAKKSPGQKTAPVSRAGKGGRKAAMLAKAKGLRAQANGLEVKIGGLQNQLNGITNAGKSTTHGGSKATGTTTKGKTAAKARKSATTKTRKAGKATTKRTTSTASASATQANSLRNQIGQLKVQVRQLRGRASALVLKARAL